ncbi:hypothetical protein V5F77_27125 [Xanthobacter sp. DSM 24535]|uniref:hypothetical protein n=1 Tax=Roseixanthobacter psychrophilus TaxID=3119917 RepID=UPI00372C315B
MFEADRTLTDFPVAQRSELLRLIECLLTEAVAACVEKAQSDDPATKEAAHDQDHA